MGPHRLRACLVEIRGSTLLDWKDLCDDRSSAFPTFASPDHCLSPRDRNKLDDAEPVDWKELPEDAPLVDRVCGAACCTWWIQRPGVFGQHSLSQIWHIVFHFIFLVQVASAVQPAAAAEVAALEVIRQELFVPAVHLILIITLGIVIHSHRSGPHPLCCSGPACLVNDLMTGTWLGMSSHSEDVKACDPACLGHRCLRHRSGDAYGCDCGPVPAPGHRHQSSGHGTSFRPCSRMRMRSYGACCSHPSPDPGCQHLRDFSLLRVPPLLPKEAL